MLIPIIMAGGSGSRLWPLSRSLYPKQFLSFSSESNSSMLQMTVKRLEGLNVSKPITICNEEHRFVVAEQLRTISVLGDILLEPVGRNTAPALALAAFMALHKNTETDPLLLVLAADHIIEDQNSFISAVESAILLAESGKLVTFGVSPLSAHTGYGYIKCGAQEGSGYIVERFKEKPDAETASQYIESGGYYWNSGIFLMKASRYLEELERFRPDIFKACKKTIEDTVKDLDFTRIKKELFESCPEDSIDYAVMEKTSSAIVVPLDAGWNDIGSWSALWDIGKKDSKNNVINGDVAMHNTSGCYIQTGERLVAAIGLEDIVIVDTKDAVLVASKDQVQDVKEIVERLKKHNRPEATQHREVYRPWGKYDSINSGNRYQVKRITVKPGAKLSLQMHHHRAEHWIVVSGTAMVTIGDKQSLLTENESTYIPIGTIHCLENPGKVDLELIEVQSGSYLGEDDIIRFEDKYGRV